jgi:putative membrane protein insertion efficiency factor
MLRSSALKPTTAISSPDGIGPVHEANDGRLAVVAALALLRAYKVLISPLFTGCCRFEPSCSDYMAESIRVHGLFAGTWRGAKRLSRCHPFGGHGFDPVPRP